MNISEEHEIKKEFQLERVILFSDAVFAIIITIMVIDIKLPEGIHHANATEVREAFRGLIPKLVAYSISFFLIGNFWLRHLKIFSFLRDYNTTLIIFNLVFLFSISLFPFAVAFVASGLDIMHYTWGIFTYVGIIFLVILSQTFLVHYLVKNKSLLCVSANNMETVLKWKVQRLNYIFVPLSIILMAAIAYFDLQAQILIYFVGLYGFVVGKLSKRYYPEQDNSTLLFSKIFRRKKKAPVKHR